jgi:hypothetical protein
MCKGVNNPDHNFNHVYGIDDSRDFIGKTLYSFSKINRR